MSKKKTDQPVITSKPLKTDPEDKPLLKDLKISDPKTHPEPKKHLKNIAHELARKALDVLTNTPL